MQRPLIHFAPAKGWMNDPNGPIYADGLWHLFYQYNPFGSEWGNICWAYATSPDLISWTRRGVRLAPDTAHGERWCFSGCTVPTPHGYAFLYTSVGFGENAARDRAVQRICASNRSFTRTRRCGTITPDLHPLPVTEWRDPFVFERGGARYLLLAGVMNGKGNILLYKAADESLLHWKFLCPLFSRAGDILECPNAVMFGDTMLLLYSSIRENRVRYAVGRFAGGQLAVAAEGVVDHGENCFYATNLARGEHGGTVLFAWLKESLLHGSSPDGSYSGCLALPRTVHLENGRPVYAFAEGLRALSGRALPAEGGAVRTPCERAHLSFRTRGEGEATLLETGNARVRLKVVSGEMHILREGTPCGDMREIVLPVRMTNEVEAVCDGTAVELLVNSCEAASFRFYPGDPVVTLFAAEEGFVSELRACELLPAPMADDESQSLRMVRREGGRNAGSGEK